LVSALPLEARTKKRRVHVYFAIRARGANRESVMLGLIS
jgi:hypothetical protein